MEIEATDAEKPDGWLDDEENLIPDPDAEKPEDWWVKFSKTLKIQTPTFQNTPFNSIKFGTQWIQRIWPFYKLFQLQSIKTYVLGV